MRSVLMIAIGLAMFGCSPSDGPKVGGETHWLALCSHDSDCGDEDLQCICGTCTKACEGDEACHGGQCYDSKSPVLRDRCEEWDSNAAPAICLAQCERDSECKSGQHCVQGACVPASTEPIDLSDFADVSDEVSWSEPVATITLPDTIASAPASMLGIWRELDCDPNNPPPPPRAMYGCVSLDIQRDNGGSVRGVLRFERKDNRVLGPFAAASDPEHGYPVESTQYATIATAPQPQVDYRLLDAKASDSKLLFEWSLFDVWHEWCQLQTPYRWDIAGRGFYFCVPQDRAVQNAMDWGRVSLCKPSELDATCPSGSLDQACACGDNPSCTVTVCQCDGQRCDMRPVTLPTEVQFASDGATAVLTTRKSGFSVEATLGRSVQ